MELVTERKMSVAAESGLMVADESALFPRASTKVMRFDRGTYCTEDRPVISESTFTVRVNGKVLSKLQCSKTALSELAYGFLFNEGVIAGIEDVQAFELDQKALVASFELAEALPGDIVPVRASGFGGAALALAEHLNGNETMKPGVESQNTYSMNDIARAMQIMKSFAREYTITRGIHCSAIFMGQRPLASYEDIGRHNTFDKLAGASLLKGFDVRGSLLATTGRISSEMARKAQRLGVSAIASLSGPTDQAVEIAKSAGMFMVGYVRDDSGVIYA